MEYEVRLDSFEGPLDLLYQMVKKEKIEINEISLAQLTEQYLEYTNYFQSFDLDTASEFILIAGQLIQLKTRYLLPENNIFQEEEEDETDLVERLQEYEFFKDLSHKLKDKKNTAERIFFRPSEMTYLTEEEYRLELDISAGQLFKYLKQALQDEEEENREQAVERMNYVQLEKIEVEDKIKQVKEKLKKSQDKLNFFKLVEDKRNLLEIAATLLGVLEMAKMDEIRIIQDNLFSEIFVIPFNKGGA